MLHLALAALLAIDPAKSTATFAVQHIFVERVTGTVPIVSGTIDLPEGSLVPTSVSAVLDPKKFHSDESDRDAAMQTPDWFDTPDSRRGRSRARRSRRRRPVSRWTAC